MAKRYTREEMSQMSSRELQRASTDAVSKIFKSIFGFIENRRMEKEEAKRREQERIERERKRKQRLLIIKIASLAMFIFVATIVIILVITKPDFLYVISGKASAILASIGNFFVYIFGAIKTFFMKIPDLIKGIIAFFGK
jgi:cation transport ATPase